MIEGKRGKKGGKEQVASDEENRKGKPAKKWHDLRTDIKEFQARYRQYILYIR